MFFVALFKLREDLVKFVDIVTRNGARGRRGVDSSGVGVGHLWPQPCGASITDRRRGMCARLVARSRVLALALALASAACLEMSNYQLSMTMGVVLAFMIQLAVYIRAWAQR